RVPLVPYTTLFRSIVLYPFVFGDRPQPGLSGALTLALFVAAFWAVAGERRIRIVAALLAAPAIAGNLLTVAAPRFQTFVPGILFGILFLAFVTLVIFRGVVMSPEVSRE